MCDACRTIKTATWVFIDVKHSDKTKWSNKCLLFTVLRLCHGHVRRHAHICFNRRCANDVVSRSTSCQSVEILNAVRDFLRIHNFHIHVIEPVTHDRWEDFILGSGSHRLGSLLWDTTSGHASVASQECSQQCFATFVSSEPWTRSSVGVNAYPQVLPPNMKLFKPLDFNSDCAPDGYFIIDSFHCFKTSKKKTEYYLPRLLSELQRHTGLTIFALCSGGAAILHRSNGSALYSEMLDYVPSGLQFIC